MQYWKAHYKDKLHNQDIKILNTQEDYKTDPLSFEIDGIVFKGTSLECFELADPQQYEIAKEKFSILKWGGYNSRLKTDFPVYYDLQRYELEADIPVNAVRKSDGKIIGGTIHAAFRMIERDKNKYNIIVMCDGNRVYPGDYIVSEFSLSVDGKIFRCGKLTLCFENALNELSRLIKDEYYLKCCFTCQFSEYSIYGNDNFGTMLCYRRNKAECLKVNSKDDWFEFLEDKKFDLRQENYLCNDYEPRNKASGYRGFVDGFEI